MNDICNISYFSEPLPELSLAVKPLSTLLLQDDDKIIKNCRR